ncbi:hypothetical protein GCM10018773_60490 [Streptomyces candidus]|nr:hypothetical protein GCM10018773_60490 [Streptomyces candidus]
MSRAAAAGSLLSAGLLLGAPVATAAQLSDAQSVPTVNIPRDDDLPADAFFQDAPLDGSVPESQDARLAPAAVAGGNNKWGCGATVGSPHPSGGAVKVHGTIKCKAAVPSGKVSNVQLWRSRWWGWEKVGPAKSYSNTNAKYIDASTTYKPGSKECHYYRGTATFTITGVSPNEVFNYDQHYLKGKKEPCGVNW